MRALASDVNAEVAALVLADGLKLAGSWAGNRREWGVAAAREQIECR
jgi:hypothetical protein